MADIESRLLRRLVAGYLASLLALSTPVTAGLLWIDGFEAEADPFLDERRVRSVLDSVPPSPTAAAALVRLVAVNDGWPVGTRSGNFLFAIACVEDGWALSMGNVGDPQPMARYGALCWSEQKIAQPDELEYRFVPPGEAAIADPDARRYRYVASVETSLVRAFDPHIQRWDGFGPAVGLAERGLRIWVPEGGVFDRVLYMHDGQELFDPNAPSGGWQMQDRTPPGVLLVGIDSSMDRIFEFTHRPQLIAGVLMGGGGDLYADLLEHHVRPRVARRYGDAAIHGLLGAGLGGLVSLHIPQRHPLRYAFAASLSGTLNWGAADNDRIVERYIGAGRDPSAVYLDSGGGEGGCTDNYCATIDMRSVLLQNGYVAEHDLWYRWAPSAPHNVAAWRERVPFAMERFAALAEQATNTAVESALR
jgi:predicted alpha/beta superfamily hydrolase